MRIADENGNPLDCVYLAPTDTEAKELRDYLNQLVTREKGWHAHVYDERFLSADESERVGARSNRLSGRRRRDGVLAAHAAAWASVRECPSSGLGGQRALEGGPVGRPAVRRKHVLDRQCE